MASAVCCDLFPQRASLGNLCFLRGEPLYGPEFCCGAARHRAGPRELFEPHLAGRSLLPRSCNETTVDLRGSFERLSQRAHADLGLFSFAAVVAETRTYLRHGVVTASLRMLLRTLDVLWPFALRVCAPAAWLSLLLRAEELTFLDPTAAGEMLSLAAEAWKISDVAGQARTVDAGLPEDAWSLAHELYARVLQLQRAAVATVAAAALSVDVVVFGCSSSSGDLAHLRRLGPGDVPRAATQERSRLFLYDLCRPFGRGQRAFQPFEVAQIPIAESNPLRRAARRLAQAFAKVQLLSFDEEVPTAGTGAALAHVAAFYDDLADVNVFLHADFVEHVLDPLKGRVLQSLENGLWPQSLDFMYLSWYHLPARPDGRVGSTRVCYCLPEGPKNPVTGCCPEGGSSLSCVFLERLWQAFFGCPLDSLDDVGGYANSQFLVRSAAVWQRGRSFFARAARSLGSHELWAWLPAVPGRGAPTTPAPLRPRSVTPRGPLVAAAAHARNTTTADPLHPWPAYAWMEALWHIIFGVAPSGEHARPCLTRPNDPRVPFFLKDFIWHRKA